MGPMPRRQLGSSGIEVSVLALGSWMTFEQIPLEQGVAVMRAARDAGIDFLDDARYDDRTGTAPIPTGYSEVRFGELFRAAGWKRADVVVANKLWLEFWPRESVAAELDASLQRMGFDYLDLEYCAPPPDGMDLAELVSSIGDLIASGKLRAWGVLNWSVDQLHDAVRIATGAGVPPPCAAQLPYNVVFTSVVEDPLLVELLEVSGIRVVASAVLAGGALTGKYAEPAARGRIAANLDSPQLRRALAAGDRLREVAASIGEPPAALAIAFALANPYVASVLFGATTPEQVAENARAVPVLAALTPAQIASLRER
jgi:aryl-alcohol dehydrogenase-like predicted oxidoreductase